MGIRTGKQYIEALKKVKAEIYMNGRRVEDVTEEPIFQGPIRTVAELYDMQFDPKFKDITTYPSPTTGNPISMAFMVPYTKEDLIKKRQYFKLRADQNFGTFGRSPDFTNGLVTGWYQGSANFARMGEQYGQNAIDYYEYVSENDLFLTHVLVGPQVDRSRIASEQADPFIQLGKVGETEEGIIVRGAKMLGTMAPITEECAVVPFGGVAAGDHIYALAFSVPNNAPGLKWVCRETVAPLPRSTWDHPLSSRFEEMDCIAIFDDVLIPWNRVIVPGTPECEELVNNMRGSMSAQGAGQGAAAHLSQMELMVGVAMRLAESTGISGFLNIQHFLGEMVSYLEVFRAVFYGTEAMSEPGPNGVWRYGGFGSRSVDLLGRTWHRRMVEIIQSMAGGGFFQSATEADMNNPEIRPYIDKFMSGREGWSAEDRIRIFKLAWDITGDSFGQRVQQYHQFHAGDPYRAMAASYVGYDKQPLFDIVDRALGKTGTWDIAITPENAGGVPVIKPEPGSLQYAYPAASAPKRTRPLAKV